MELNDFMRQGVKDILSTASRYYLRDAKGAAALARAATGMRAAQKRRDAHEAAGTHVPPFLIASIASLCNLDCTGCYARANGAIGDAARANELSDDTWAHIFDEADELGVSFILLAGGEPTLRRPVIEAAATHDGMIFPVFTNGSFIDQSWLDLFNEKRNLIPVFSLEGDDETTDARRGEGVAAQVRANMLALQNMHVLWGVSITVTEENLAEVTDDAFVAELYARGCGLIIYNEYVPIACGTEALAMGRPSQQRLMARVAEIGADKRYSGLNVICFPGNEELMGGCLAAGRGFFHISQSGGAEPCPFSPYSVANVAEVGLLSVLQSEFFARIREVEAAHSHEHTGGCTLFQHKEEVERILQAVG